MSGFESIYPIIRNVARRKAAMVVGQCGLTPEDREDIASELVIDFYFRLGCFDPERASLRTFASQVMQRKLISMLRFHGAQRRGASARHTSLSQVTTDGDGNPIEVGDLLSDQAGREHEPSAAERHEFWLDAHRALVSLPPQTRRVAATLCLAPAAEVARSLRRPRASVYREIRQIRRAFTDAGITREYFATAGGAR